MGNQPLIEDIILTSKIGSINKIEGDKDEVMRAIYSLHTQGLIKIVAKDEQSTPMIYRVTEEGKLH